MDENVGWVFRLFFFSPLSFWSFVAPPPPLFLWCFERRTSFFSNPTDELIVFHWIFVYELRALRACAFHNILVIMQCASSQVQTRCHVTRFQALI